MTTDFLKLTREAYEASTAYMEANWRPDLDYSLRAFRNEHASGSKYLSPEYAARSKLFRPKTRSIIRKNEAAAAVALFSNSDVVNITPGNPDDLMSVAAAAADKELLEFRMSKTIPAFPLVMGAVQDAQTTGVVCSYQYWKYQSKNGRKIKDEPCIELRPIENIRLDGGADWLDPVNSSPYFADIIPMYVCDVRAMMNSKDEKTGQKWKKYKDDVILKARPDVMSSTANLRLGNKQDPVDERPNIKDFDIVWVMRWFMRDSNGDDFTYFTLGTEALLSDPKPIEDVYFHGKRPYVIGYAILETHKPLKTSLPSLIRPLQQEANSISNDRIDNVKFVLHKRWFVTRGRQTDINSLVRGVPGGVTLTANAKEDVQESNWPDVTSSSYVEHDRINAELDDLGGNFSPSTRVANNAVNDTLGGSKLAMQSSGVMTDYLIRTIIETWYEPVLRQLLLLERYYETDDVVLAVCAQKAQLFRRFGLSKITDDLLMKEVNVSVNVGMGSTNPNERFQKAMMFFGAANQLVLSAPPGANVQEQIKELASGAGYRDGARFYNENQDPRLAKALQMLQQYQQVLQGKQLEFQASAQVEQMKLVSAERQKAAQLQVDQGRIQGDLQIRAAELVVEQQRLALEEFKIQAEIMGMTEEHKLKIAELSHTIDEAQTKLEGERLKLVGIAAKTQAEIEKARVELQTEKLRAQNEAQASDTVSKVTKSMEGVSKEIADAKAGIEGIGDMKTQVAQHGQALSLLLQDASTKKKAKGLKLKKKDGKTVGVIVENHDGSVEELTVN
jgi:hypothetical protein